MAEKILFSEQQRFKQWWLWALLIVVGFFPVVGLIREMQSVEPFSDAEKNTGLILSLVFLIPVIILFFVMRLQTKITEKGIAARFVPFHLKFQQFPWEKIDQVNVRKYSPISEFGGWGLRFGMLGSGKAYNVSGDQGIQIVFKNGKKLLIGTNKPEEARAALKQLEPAEA